MAHAEVEEEDPVKEDDEPSNEEYPSYASFLKVSDFINVNVVADQNNVNHKVRGQCFFFNGDKVSDLGFLHVEKYAAPTNQDQGVVLANTGMWIIQGRRGSNTTKIQRPRAMSPEKKTAPSVIDAEAKPVRIQKCVQKTGKKIG